MLYLTHESSNIIKLYTHPRHKFNKNGEFPLFEVPKTAIVLNNTLVAQVLQQLNLALQSIHLLQNN